MVNWTAETDRALLLHLLDVCGVKLTTAHYQEAAKRMGTEYSHSSVSQRYLKKLRKEVGDGATGASTAAATEETTKGPAKGGKGKGKGRKRKQPGDDEDAEGDVEPAIKATKKTKKGKEKKAADDEEQD
ncbi:hypothetical protein MBLNU230_g2117t1 [Neophaeotheca triangularis]